MERQAVPETVIDPRTALDFFDFREVLGFRGLLYFLVWRDVKVRYKQSVLGIAWVLLKPLATMAIFTVIFGRIAKFPSEGAPYSVFVLTGLIPWSYFSSTLLGSASSIVGGGGLISKVYFPRLIAPVAAALSQMVDALISFLFLLALMLIYGITPGAGLLLVPLLFIYAAVTALGPGMLFAALYVKYRDVGHLVPFVAQVWMYLTPVIYPPSFIPGRYGWLLYLNPMSGVVEAFRAALLPDKTADPMLLASSLVVSGILFLAGLLYFRAVERSFADNI